MGAEFLKLEELEEHVREIVAAKRAAEVFRTLLTSSRLAAPRAAVFLVRRDGIRGWGCVGYDPTVTRTHRAFRAPLGHGWLGSLRSNAESTGETRHSAGDPDFGQQPAAESFGCVVRVKGKPIALLVVERSMDEGPWFPQVIQTMVSVGQLRLELDVALRKLGHAPTAQESRPAATADPAPAAKVPTEPQAATETIPAPAIETAPAAEPYIEPVFEPIVETVVEHEPAAELPPATETQTPTETATEVAESAADDEPTAEDAVLEAARRYARLVATDIRLYNEESVMLGRRHGDLIDRLGDQLDRGKETFLRRHGALGPTGLSVLHEAYVQVLAGGDGQLIPDTALD